MVKMRDQLVRIWDLTKLLAELAALVLAQSFFTILLAPVKTWLALIACRRATRATEAPASNVSSTIRPLFFDRSPSPLGLD